MVQRTEGKRMMADAAGAESQPLAGNIKHTSATSARAARKCTQTYFLLSALTIGQVFLLSLFFLWTIKTCYSKYQHVIVVYEVDAQPRTISAHSNHHGNQHRLSDNATDNEHKSISTLRNTAEAYAQSNHGNRANFTIIGSARSADLDITLNWYESVRRLHLNYDVALLARDGTAYEILTKRQKGSRRMQNAQLKIFDVFSTPTLNGTYISSSINQYLAELKLVLGFLKGGRDVVLVDTQSVWLRDPLPLVWDMYEKCDFISVQLSNNITNQTASSPRFSFIKSRAKTISLVESIMKRVAMEYDDDAVNGTTLTSLLMAKAYDRSTDNTRNCNFNSNYIPPEETVFRTDGWYLAHKDKVHVVHLGAIPNFKTKREMLLHKKWWYLRQKLRKHSGS